MIDFLKDYGINDETIEKIKNVNSSANLYNLNCNQDEIVKIVDYLNKLGINCIDQLFIHRIDMFFVGFDKFKLRFDKPDVDRFVQLINDDYTLIDEL